MGVHRRRVQASAKSFAARPDFRARRRDAGAEQAHPVGSDDEDVSIGAMNSMAEAAFPPSIAKPSSGPSSLARTVVFGVVWFPFAVMISFAVPMFDPIFRKLEEMDQLPALTSGLAGFR